MRGPHLADEGPLAPRHLGQGPLALHRAAVPGAVFVAALAPDPEEALEDDARAGDRRLSHGSDSEGGAEFTAIMYSVVGTLSMNGIDVLRWLEAWLIEIPNLGSHILVLVRRRLPEDWTERYRTTPVLIETFVETPRYTGAVYRASGWTYVGTTQGRGRYDREKLYDKPRRDVWLRPLRRDWKRALNR